MVPQRRVLVEQMTNNVSQLRRAGIDMKILLGVIAVILVLGFASVCWLLYNLLEKMHYVKVTADIIRAENVRALHHIKSQVRRK